MLRKNDPALVPIAGDGVDVTLDAAGSRWTFDVALHVPETRLVVAECRRRGAPVKQEDFAAFAVNVKVDRLRQSVGVSVAGVFFAKSRYQVGAVRSGQHEGVTMAVVGDREIIGDGFVIEYHRWDATVGKVPRTRRSTLDAQPASSLRVVS